MFGKVPHGWRNVRLGEVVKLEIGRTPPRNRPEFWDRERRTTNRWACIADLKGRFLYDTAEYLSDLGVRHASARLVPAGTVLLSFKLTIGKVTVTTAPVYTNEAIAAVYADTHATPSFLVYALAVAATEGPTDQTVKGITLNKAKLERLPLHLPPLTEQRKIAEILSSVDDAVEKTESIIRQVQEVKRGLMQQLLTRGIPGRHTRFKKTEVGEIPEEWEVVRIGEVASVVSGFALGPSRRGETNLRPYLTVANVQAGKIDLSPRRFMAVTPKEYEGRSIRAGDVLMVEGHAQISELGRAAVATASVAGYTFQNHLFRVRVGEARCNASFLCALINSQRGRAYFRSFGGTTSGLNTVSTTNVQGMPVPLPPIDEQREVERVLRRVDARLATDEELSSTLRHVKDALMRVLLTGEVRVKLNAPEGILRE